MESEESEIIRTNDVKVSEEYQFNKFHLSEKLQKSLAASKFVKVRKFKVFKRFSLIKIH